ncbi:hypothetical protein FN846DRAFT_908226 [Sphaerosporella brunnea]|uniref:DUF7598 domain-containing protein n=1 Tax=Sphaerosporella brunnea TaxID=1250544 RepID=A0A5J5EUB9_9PEZI|nr:hypothetical protein FN846DRAFT_908215 [Sphaerosporella brunnea]KAA8903193.1 hypothetical protein FN846DRAFT_908226 [Sphaerosporella brunnea]
MSPIQRPTDRGFWALNVLRVLSIISLISSIVAAMTTLIKSFVATKFFFFDALGHIFLTGICIFLILSECSLLRDYFNHNWQVFSADASLTWLGVAEVGVGVALLGNLNEDFPSKASMGSSFNALLIASGVCVCFTGLASFIASFIYRVKSTSETARMLRSIKRRRKLRQLQLPDTEDTPAPTIVHTQNIQLPERVHSRNEHEARSYVRTNNSRSNSNSTLPQADRSQSGFFRMEPAQEAEASSQYSGSSSTPRPSPPPSNAAHTQAQHYRWAAGLSGLPEEPRQQ